MEEAEATVQQRLLQQARRPPSSGEAPMALLETQFKFEEMLMICENISNILGHQTLQVAPNKLVTIQSRSSQAILPTDRTQGQILVLSIVTQSQMSLTLTNQRHKAGKEKDFSDLQVWMPQTVLLPSTKVMDHLILHNHQRKILKGNSMVPPNNLFCRRLLLGDQTLQTTGRSLDIIAMIVNEVVIHLDHYIPLVILLPDEDMEQREAEASPRMLLRQAEFGK
jgi:hypothetical protein